MILVNSSVYINCLLQVKTQCQSSLCSVVALYRAECFLVTGWHFLLGLLRDFCISIINFLNVLWLTQFWLRNVRNILMDQSTRVKSCSVPDGDKGRCFFREALLLSVIHSPCSPHPLNPESSCWMLEKKTRPCLVFVVLMDLVCQAFA